jgi:DNA-binding ferritin-like protein (Dps family)
MRDDIIVEKLEKIFYECDKHLLRINQAYTELQEIMPLDEQKYINLDNEQVKVLDQFLFRFSKLQDAMGQKLFKTILLFLNEEIEGKPFIDILNLMEKLHLLHSANDWKELRNDRNELAHNYEDEPKEMSETINKLYSKKELLEDIYFNIKSFYKKRIDNPQC